MTDKYDGLEKTSESGCNDSNFCLNGLHLNMSGNITPTTPIERHHRDIEPSELLPYLFVGAEAHADNENIIRKYSITHILNLTTRPTVPFDNVEYCTIEILV